MSTVWVVAADSSRARVLETNSRRGQLVEVEDLVHPEARQQAQELKSDAPGRAFDSGGQGRHAMGTERDPKQQEAIRFAKRVCQTLTTAHGEGRFDKLYILAAPAFLGLLRDCLNPTIRDLIAGEFNKNLAAQTVDDIRRHLPEWL